MEDVIGNNYSDYKEGDPEIWVDLVDKKLQGAEDKYSISSYGRVWNKVRDCEVSSVRTGRKDMNNDYYYVNLHVRGEKSMLRRVHYIMACSFFGVPPEDDAGVIKKQTCDHINRDRFNNNLWNLRWLSRKAQQANRKCAIMWNGENLLQKIRKDFGDEDPSRETYLRTFINTKGYDYETARELYLQREEFGESIIVIFKNNPVYLTKLCDAFNLNITRCRKLLTTGYSIENIFPTFKVKEEDFRESYETDNMWYPTKKALREGESIGEQALNKRLKKGMGVVEALEYDHYDRNRWWLDGAFMSTPEHCKRLGISHSRVQTYRSKHKMSREAAIEKAKTPTRIIKHSVNGVSEIYGSYNNEVKRNKAWWEVFGVNPIYGNNKMCSKNTKHPNGYSMEEVLKLKGIDLTGLTFTPYTK